MLVSVIKNDWPNNGMTLLLKTIINYSRIKKDWPP